MQETRRYILEILKIRGQATVDHIVNDLQNRRGPITAVTVRHHLSRLREDGLVSSPQLRHRATPGRPQHIYTLTDKALSWFPNNYQQLAYSLLEYLQSTLQDDDLNAITSGVAERIADKAEIPDGPLADRIEATVDYLNQQGYKATWETDEGGYILHTYNCPYHEVIRDKDSLCNALCHMDARLVALLLRVTPQVVSRISDGNVSCSYHVPADLS